MPQFAGMFITKRLAPAGEHLREDFMKPLGLSSNALAHALEGSGHRVVMASDGEEAYAKANQFRPDLVITDVNMPNMNGLELTRRLRADHRTARIPVIMLSARKQADDVLSGYAEGADEYIPKPVEMAVLAAKVEVLIRRFATTHGEAVAKRGGNVVLTAFDPRGPLRHMIVTPRWRIVWEGWMNVRPTYAFLTRPWP